MKFFTRKISGILAAVLVLSAFSGMAFAAEGKVSHLSADQIGLLQYLGIPLTEEKSYDAEITRGELAHIAARVANLQAYDGEGSFFYDVPTNYKYADDIFALYSAGIVSGDGAGNYSPNDISTEQEISKIFSIILGYKDIGYFEEFYRIANRIGLLDGINLDGVLTYGEALGIAYKALHLEMLEGTLYGEKKEYATTNGYLAIERYHGLVMQRGIVEGGFGTMLTHVNENLLDGYVSINDRTYLYPDNSFLGQNVVYYTKATHRDSISPTEIVYMHSDSQKNHIMKLDGEDIINYSNCRMEYWNKDRKATVQLKSNFDTIYNGYALSLPADEDLQPKSGLVTLIDNDGDNLYDVAIVDAYQYVAFNGYDEENELVYIMPYPDMTGKEPDSVCIGDTDRKKDITFRHPKGDIMVSRIERGTIMSLREAKNARGTYHAEFGFGIESVTGYVESYDVGNSIEIEGTQYTMSEAAIYDAQPISLRQMVTVYLHQGKCIAVIHAENNDYQYGYLVDLKLETKFFKPTLVVKMLDAQKKMQEFSVGNKIFIDEDPFDDMERVVSYLKDSALKSRDTYLNENSANVWEYSQLVRYRLNNDGVLTHLDTHKTGAGGKESDKALSFDWQYKYGDTIIKGETTARYFTGVKSLLKVASGTSSPKANEAELICAVDANTKFLRVPFNAKDEEHMYTGSMQTNERTYYAEVYNMDPETRIADFVLFYQAKSKEVDYAKAPYIVTGIEKTLDEEGYPITQIKLVGALAGETTLEIASDSSLDFELQVGMVLHVLEEQGKLVAAYPLDMATWPEDTESNRVLRAGSSTTLLYDITAQFRATFGTVLSVKDNMFVHTTSFPGEKTDLAKDGENILAYHTSSNSTQFYIFDRTEPSPTVRLASIEKLEPYLRNPNTKQRILVYSSSGTARFVYIII